MQQVTVLLSKRQEKKKIGKKTQDEGEVFHHFIKASPYKTKQSTIIQRKEKKKKKKSVDDKNSMPRNT